MGLIQDGLRRQAELDEQLGFFEVLSRLGVNEQGVPTMIDPMNKDKSIQPLMDSKAGDLVRSKIQRNKDRNFGELEAYNRIAIGMLNQKMGGEPKFQTEVVPGVTLPLTAGQKANVLMEQQRAGQAPAGKQFWEGDDQAPAGYYTPGQIENIRQRRVAQKASTEFRQLRSDIDIAKTKTGEKLKELNEFSAAYGFPTPLFESKTKIYKEGSKVTPDTPGFLGLGGSSGQVIPKGYYGFEAINPHTKEIEIRHIGKEEFEQGKKIYNELKNQRTTIGELGGKVQTSTAKARAMLDWAEKNPGAAGAAQVRMKAQADLAELGLIASGGQPTPSPTPVPEEE